VVLTSESGKSVSLRSVLNGVAGRGGESVESGVATRDVECIDVGAMSLCDVDSVVVVPMDADEMYVNDVCWKAYGGQDGRLKGSDRSGIRWEARASDGRGAAKPAASGAQRSSAASRDVECIDVGAMLLRDVDSVVVVPMDADDMYARDVCWKAYGGQDGRLKGSDRSGIRWEARASHGRGAAKPAASGAQRSSAASLVDAIVVDASAKWLTFRRWYERTVAVARRVDFNMGTALNNARYYTYRVLVVAVRDGAATVAAAARGVISHDARCAATRRVCGRRTSRRRVTDAVCGKRTCARDEQSARSERALGGGSERRTRAGAATALRIAGGGAWMLTTRGDGVRAAKVGSYGGMWCGRAEHYGVAAASWGRRERCVCLRMLGGEISLSYVIVVA